MSNRFLALSTQDRKLAFDNAAAGSFARAGGGDHRCLGHRA